jgi:hypothetical protein
MRDWAKREFARLVSSGGSVEEESEGRRIKRSFVVVLFMSAIESLKLGQIHQRSEQDVVERGRVVGATGTE